MKSILIFSASLVTGVEVLAAKGKTAILSTSTSQQSAGKVGAYEQISAQKQSSNNGVLALNEQHLEGTSSKMTNLRTGLTTDAEEKGKENVEEEREQEERGDSLRHHHKKHHHTELKTTKKAKGKDSKYLPTGDHESPQNTVGLEKTTDEEFYGPPYKQSDYQVDKNPVTGDEQHRLDFPYPATQENRDYDNDFVEDSDSDGGAWDAQMEYDKIRAKVREFQVKADRAAEKLEKEQMALDQGEEEEQVKEAMKDKWAHEWGMREEEKARLEIRVKAKVDAANKLNAEVEMRTEELQQAEKELQEATKRLEESSKELKEAEQGVQGLGDARKAAIEAKEQLDAARSDQLKFEKVLTEKRQRRDEAAAVYHREQQEANRKQADADRARLRLAKYSGGSGDKTGDVGGMVHGRASTMSTALFAWLTIIFI